MDRIIINGVEYYLKEINFKGLRQLEKLGFTISILEHLEDNYWNAIGILTAFVMDKSIEIADIEIEKHIKNGGKLDDFTPLFEMVNKSDFFRSLSKQQSK